MLGLVICALLVSAALPLREYLAQRAEISRLDAAQAAQRSRVVGLEERKRLLDDPEFVKSLARDRLHFVLPGETAYVLLDPALPPTSGPARQGDAPPQSGSPWYSQVWDSVQEADRTG